MKTIFINSLKNIQSLKKEASFQSLIKLLEKPSINFSNSSEVTKDLSWLIFSIFNQYPAIQHDPSAQALKDFALQLSMTPSPQPSLRNKG